LKNAWELYNMHEDYIGRVDLAKTYPEALAQLRALFEQPARDHQLYPLLTWQGPPVSAGPSRLGICTGV
jgi:arylsulfatase